MKRVAGNGRSLVLLGLLCAGAWPAGLRGQASEETRLLREAATLEARGDFESAEDALRRLLAANPVSSSGLFALERVLKARGTPERLLPAVDAFLEAEPAASGVRYMKLRVLAEADSTDELEKEAEAWFALAPESEEPYREVSRVWARAFGTERAMAVLRRGRRAIGDEHALALEIGDLLAPGDPEAAVREWGAAVGDDGAQATAVARRVTGLPELPIQAVRDLVDEMASSHLVPRRRAAAEIALTVGLEDESLALSRDLVESLAGRARASFLTDVARRAREREMPGVAAWAYQELGSDATTPAQRRQFDQRMVEVSLAAGDTVAALEAQQRLASSYSPGSADRRRAVARAIRLESVHADPERVRDLLDSFRAAFPKAPEIDEMAAAVAASLLADGDPDGAQAVLEGVEGPRSSLERAYLLLDAAEFEEGRVALLMAVGGLAPADATEVIQFSALLQRLSPAGRAVLGAAGVLAHRGQGAEAGAAIEAGLEGVGEDERPWLLAEGARMAARDGDTAVAVRMRQRLVADFPDAPEVEEASLELARHAARTPSGVQDAIAILESLIADRPNAAVVPDARRTLERLKGGGQS